MPDSGASEPGRENPLHMMAPLMARAVLMSRPTNIIIA